MLASRMHAQSGAAMVEMAIVLSLFMAIIFAIVEFSLAYFTWHRASEGTREALRQAVVSSPATGAPLDLTCPGGAEVVTCNTAACEPILDVIQGMAPFVDGDQVTITYACSDAGDPDRPDAIAIPEVSIEVSGLSYTFAVPGIIGLDAVLQLPDVKASRTGEDLYTPTSD